VIRLFEGMARAESSTISRKLLTELAAGEREHLHELEEIYDFRYPDETTYYIRSGCATNTNYRYRPDGSMHWRRSDKVANVIEEADYRDIDVSTHWEPVPEFGDWASITRFDRTKPAIKMRDIAG